ncbi:hypothetical protein CRX59_06845 [Burkholderia thailandensis]|nr:hypothetical protein CRX59_06845 [Burkholderia thailandensis]PNE81329.1 hypothetical protein A8H34_26210 [Burkholderia thailandensis]PNE87273.1 hypothetical protein A8H30_25870 [Burkholderia thailandensis]
MIAETCPVEFIVFECTHFTGRVFIAQPNFGHFEKRFEIRVKFMHLTGAGLDLSGRFTQS